MEAGSQNQGNLERYAPAQDHQNYTIKVSVSAVALVGEARLFHKDCGPIQLCMNGSVQFNFGAPGTECCY